MSKEIGNLLTNSNIVGKTFNFNKINIKLVESYQDGYDVLISIDKNPARRWSVKIPKNIDFITTIQCNIATKDITKEEFQCYREIMQLAYALSVYFIDVKNDLRKNVLSESALTGDDFYEYAEKLLEQIHCEITKREKLALKESKL